MEGRGELQQRLGRVLNVEDVGSPGGVRLQSAVHSVCDGFWCSPWCAHLYAEELEVAVSDGDLLAVRVPGDTAHLNSAVMVRTELDTLSPGARGRPPPQGPCRECRALQYTMIESIIYLYRLTVLALGS